LEAACHIHKCLCNCTMSSEPNRKFSLCCRQSRFAFRRCWTFCVACDFIEWISADHVSRFVNCRLFLYQCTNQYFVFSAPVYALFRPQFGVWCTGNYVFGLSVFVHLIVMWTDWKWLIGLFISEWKQKSNFFTSNKTNKTTVLNLQLKAELINVIAGMFKFDKCSSLISSVNALLQFCCCKEYLIQKHIWAIERRYHVYAVSTFRRKLFSTKNENVRFWPKHENTSPLYVLCAKTQAIFCLHVVILWHFCDNSMLLFRRALQLLSHFVSVLIVFTACFRCCLCYSDVVQEKKQLFWHIFKEDSVTGLKVAGKVVNKCWLSKEFCHIVVVIIFSWTYSCYNLAFLVALEWPVCNFQCCSICIFRSYNADKMLRNSCGLIVKHSHPANWGSHVTHMKLRAG